MTDPYSVLGVPPGADEDTIKKAYRQKCKQYHPDLHPNDAAAEEKFKEVQAAYSEIQNRKNGGQTAQGSYQSYGQSGYGSRSTGYQDPFRGGYDPFGFGFYSSYGRQSQQEQPPEMQAAANYIRSGYYQEGLNALNDIPAGQRTARWHYYAALAHQGLGSNIRAQEEARTAVQMEPGNFTYQDLLNRLQNPSRTYARYQRPYAQPSGPHSFLLNLWMYMILCNLLSCCCCGRPSGFFCC